MAEDEQKVVTLTTRTMNQQKDQIEVLEAAMTLAKAGQLRAVAVVGVMSDYSTYSHIAASDVAATLLGGMTVAARRLTDAMIDGEDE